ncbi:MAG: hypothetical protein HQM08_27360 [Candidatus Riflebacteria bacterium]|nr:hypothetical protein [Candidatus Riflebacteria bacterium]
MTTEKKKRIPKPAISKEIDLLVKLLPLIEKDPSNFSDTKILNHAKKIKLEVCDFYYDDNCSLDRLKWVLHTIRTIIKVVSGITCSKEELDDVTSWLCEKDKSTFPRIYDVSPSGIVEREMIDMDKILKLPLNTIRREDLVDAVYKAFAVGGIGELYIACCPECEKVFRKFRKDQGFCSKKCADNVSKKRQRKRMSDD